MQRKRDTLNNYITIVKSKKIESAILNNDNYCLNKQLFCPF